ncbi:MAG TPA: TonB-dependent receptor plug domain-containing protein [Chitinophagaceae bacterium]|nr:TonB-dependent receptor plug domain-containing protein [Chitinophagaceae bacterium]
MKNALKILLLICAGLMPAGKLMAGTLQQPDPVRQLIEKINSWYAVPREEVPLVTDRLYYEPGDTIWFKAYILDPKDLTPSGQSNLLHVALLRGNGSVLGSLLLRQDANHLTGFFALPRKLDTGKIYLVAYTRWMLNFPGRDYSTKTLFIGSPAPHSLNQAPSPSTGRDQVRFFPESGHLVGGYSNTVAFQATGPGGGPAAVSGQITNDRGESVADFQCGADGLGSFQVPVSAKRILTARTRFGDGGTVIDTLPKAAPQAYILHTEIAGDQIRATVVPGDSIPAATRTILVAIWGGKVGFAAYGTDAYAVNIPLQTYLQGIVRIAVFSLDLKPLAERWVLPDRNPLFSCQVTRNAGALVTLSIRGIAPGPGSLSGAFYLVASDSGAMELQAPAQNLSVGNEEMDLDPDASFPGDSAKATANGLRLMIQGWKDTPWEEILGGPRIRFNHPPEMAQVLGGKVLDESGKPVTDRLISLISHQGGASFTDTTDAAGRFLFRNMAIPDSSVYLLSLSRDKKGREGQPKFIIDSTSALRLPADFTLPGQGPVARNLPEPARGNLNKKLDTVVVKDRRQPRQFHNSNTILGDEIIHFTNPFDALRTLNGVQVIVLGGSYHVIIGGIGSFHAQADPLLVIDGVEFPDLSALENLNTADIDSMQVLRGAAEYGSLGGMGVILVFTRKGGGGLATKNDHILPLTLAGFENPGPSKPLISPDRYWNADIQLDSTGDIQIQIPGLNLSGKFRASFQGVTDSGIPVRLEIPLKPASD